MSPPDDDRSNPLPTLSWNSIVDDGTGADTPDPDTEGSAEPVRISMSLRLDDDAGQAVMPSGPPPPPPPPPAPPVAAFSTTPSLAPLEPMMLRTADVVAPPAPAVAPTDDVPDLSAFKLSISPLVLAEETPAHAPIEPIADFVLPSIREATPVEPYQLDVVAPALEPTVPESPLAMQPGLAEVGADHSATTTVPVVDASAAPAISLPSLQPDQTNRPVPVASPLAIEMPQPRKPAKRRGRTGLKLVVLLVVLVAIVAGAIVFGRPYLFPDEWEANAEPYAMAVQDVTGVEFVEPVIVTAETTATYEPRATAQLTGDWESQVPMWRALGMASGDVTEASLAELLAGWMPALYSSVDGQLYHDESLTGADLDAALTALMATAQLDQQYGWAIGQPERTLDDAALVAANVTAQAGATQQASEYTTPIGVAPTAPLAYLPAVLSYEVLAPAMYAPLLAPVAPDADNPLGSLDTAGPGPLAPDAPKVAGAPELISGDVITASPAAHDRSFWYLVFASYLDAPTAFAASEAVIENAVTVADRSGTTCVYSTFAGGDLVQTASLRSALESWVATVPTEFSSAFSVTADGSLQMVSCDPGAQFVGSNRIGTARELIGWRSAEIATINGVLETGGSEADVAGALFRLVQSDVGAQLAASPVGDSPAAATEAAEAAVAPIVSPPPPPVVEPED